jgi:hypothetical protein
MAPDVSASESESATDSQLCMRLQLPRYELVWGLSGMIENAEKIRLQNAKLGESSFRRYSNWPMNTRRLAFVRER